MAGCWFIIQDKSGTLKVDTKAAGFVMLGAYAELLDDPPLDLLVEAMRELLPPYRRQHADTNAQALQRGAELAQDLGRVVA